MATVNFSEPKNTTNYSTIINILNDKIEASITMFNSVGGIYTNIPENAIQLYDTGSNLIPQKYTSGSWSDMSETFQMTVTKLKCPTSGTQEDGDYYLDLANATGSLTGTLPTGSLADSGHGQRGSGTTSVPLHAIAIADSSPGFMSALDKGYLDAIVALDLVNAGVKTKYHKLVNNPTVSQIAAGTLKTNKRYSPYTIFQSVSAKMQQAKALIYTEEYSLDADVVANAVAVDAANGNFQNITLTADTTITGFSTVGVYKMQIVITQGTAGNTLTIPSGYWEGGVKKTITTGINTICVLHIHWNGTILSYSMQRKMILVT